jgi:hypothetical protein
MKPAKPVDAQIAEVEKRRVMLALELQRANRQREDLRQKITRAGWSGFFNTDGRDLLGPGDVHDEVEWAATRLVTDGILTRAEIEDIRTGRCDAAKGSPGDNA